MSVDFGNPYRVLNDVWDQVKRALRVTIADSTVTVTGSVSTTSPTTLTLLDDVTTTGMTYVGTAPIGTATSASAWTIKRLDESGTPTTLVVKYATAGASTCIWDNRVSLTYT